MATFLVIRTRGGPEYDRSKPLEEQSGWADHAAFMDALVERHSTWGHVALIHLEGAAGSDWIVHARNNTMGTELRYLPYRSDVDYRAVARENWTAECYPSRCA